MTKCSVCEQSQEISMAFDKWWKENPHNSDKMPSLPYYAFEAGYRAGKSALIDEASYADLRASGGISGDPT